MTVKDLRVLLICLLCFVLCFVMAPGCHKRALILWGRISLKKTKNKTKLLWESTDEALLGWGLLLLGVVSNTDKGNLLESEKPTPEIQINSCETSVDKVLWSRAALLEVTNAPWLFGMQPFSLSIPTDPCSPSVPSSAALKRKLFKSRM